MYYIHRRHVDFAASPRTPGPRRWRLWVPAHPGPQCLSPCRNNPTQPSKSMVPDEKFDNLDDFMFPKYHTGPQATTYGLPYCASLHLRACRVDQKCRPTRCNPRFLHTTHPYRWRSYSPLAFSSLSNLPSHQHTPSSHVNARSRARLHRAFPGRATAHRPDTDAPTPPPALAHPCQPHHPTIPNLQLRTTPHGTRLGAPPLHRLLPPCRSPTSPTTKCRRARPHGRPNALYSLNTHTHAHALVYASADPDVQQPAPAAARGHMGYLTLPTRPREPPHRASRPP